MRPCFLKTLALAALAAWSFNAFAESPPPKLLVSVSACGQPVSYSSYATPAKLADGRSFLIAGAPDLSPDTKVCAELAGTQLKPVAFDHAMGLAAYELPANWSGKVYDLYQTHHLFFDHALSPMGTSVRMQFSTRHYLPLEWQHKFQYLEVMPKSGKNQDFFQAVGAPLGSSVELAGILSDQTLVTLPGQPAKVFRKRDLSRLSITPFIYYRIAFSPNTVAAWLTKALNGAKPELSLLEPTKNNQTLWSLAGHRIQETCFAAGEASASDNVPVGGIKPEGVGGLEDVLSSCRYSIEPGSEAIPALASLLAKGKSTRLFLLYQRKEGRLQLQSIQNVQHLLQLVKQKGWSYLVEQDFLQGSADPALRLLRDKAIAARDAAVDFFQKEYGDPMILRRAFVLASLANSRDYAQVTAAELEQLGKDIATDLPDHLRELDIRGNGPGAKFVAQKKALLEKFKELQDARSQLP